MSSAEGRKSEVRLMRACCVSTRMYQLAHMRFYPLVPMSAPLTILGEKMQPVTLIRMRTETGPYPCKREWHSLAKAAGLTHDKCRVYVLVWCVYRMGSNDTCREQTGVRNTASCLSGEDMPSPPRSSAQTKGPKREVIRLCGELDCCRELGLRCRRRYDCNAEYHRCMFCGSLSFRK